ncbi:MAG: porin [Pseudomonadota bacterium]
MKKLLLSSAAICGLVAFSAAEAQAQIEVSVGGHTKQYLGWLDQDTDTGVEERNFDHLAESELHFNAVGVADNGLEYGFHVEMEVDNTDGDDTIEESYLFLSGDWGRVNVGAEDGSNYLLQIAAPSADANVDGIRQYIQPVNYELETSTSSAVADFVDADGFDYDNDETGKDNKVTYLSPIMNGFQAGFSFTPEVGDDLNGLTGFNEDDEEDDLGSAYEVALRYEGTFNNVGLALGGGFTHIEVEEDADDDADDFQEWNVGLDLDIGAFGLGAIYTQAEGGDSVGGGSFAHFGADAETDTIVVGADYTTGPFKLGASWFNQDSEDTFIAGEVETDRYTAGVIYTVAEGLTFRGSVSHIEHDIEGADDVEATSVLGGVQFNF